MPYSFTKIEKEKTKAITLVFSFLVLFYFFTFWVIIILVTNYLHLQGTSSTKSVDYQIVFPSLFHTISIFMFAFVFGATHWYFTTSNIIKKILGILKAQKLDPKDAYHKQFQNILDEVSVATGGVKIEGVVLPTMAMNAFALADFNGVSIIGVTEGVLARLTRAQVEAIVGHEAAHIVSGDCLATTVTSSLFEMYSGMLRGIELILRSTGTGRRRVSTRSGGGAGVLAMLLIVYIFIAVTRFLSQLAKMFISRQREYRADAIAVRLTRDPLSLAEALYAIAYHWRGEGLSVDELEAIFIVNPKFSAVDETDGAVADLFATHPPVKNRLKILLDMAHADVDILAKGVEAKAEKPRREVPDIQPVNARWMAHKDGKWQGPYELVQMATFGWLKPETWVQRAGGVVQMAYEDQDLAKSVSPIKGNKGAHNCPRCQLPLQLLDYEGVEVEKCGFCHGTLVQGDVMHKIIFRQEVGFPERIKKIAEGINKEGDTFLNKPIKADPNNLHSCPHCSHQNQRMLKMFYTEAYRIEVDKCIYCGHIWFDKDELEVLQVLVEGNVNQDQRVQEA